MTVTSPVYAQSGVYSDVAQYRRYGYGGYRGYGYPYGGYYRRGYNNPYYYRPYYRQYYRYGYGYPYGGYYHRGYGGYRFGYRY